MGRFLVSVRLILLVIRILVLHISAKWKTACTYGWRCCGLSWGEHELHAVNAMNSTSARELDVDDSQFFFDTSGLCIYLGTTTRGTVRDPWVGVVPGEPGRSKAAKDLS